jgi:hypothetical protein
MGSERNPSVKQAVGGVDDSREGLALPANRDCVSSGAQFGKKNSLYMRDAALALGISKTAEAKKLRGFFP